MTRRAKKSKKNHYFTKVTENAIVKYASTEDTAVRTKLYIEHIQPAFNELVDKIVFTYKFTSLQNIEFLKNDELEIICIPPWKIENIVSKVDHFHNASSFQEMSELAVKNYFNLISKLLNKDSLSLIVYKGGEKNETLSSAKINNIFENKLLTKEFSDFEQHQLLYLISK